MTNREFIELVAQMRAAQRTQRCDRSIDWLTKVRRLEESVDAVLQKIGGPETQNTFFETGPIQRGRNIGRIDAMIAVRMEEEMREIAESMKTQKDSSL